ncbi:nucleoside diphosphate kinase regulator [Pigmentiphaga soli]|uniref:Nucleoside diphosphate kinase regulator n=1 Tax=Pigmentiphaga soli TaxID=1007095 RepID=A0ABP8HNN9_9BURK
MTIALPDDLVVNELDYLRITRLLAQLPRDAGVREALAGALEAADRVLPAEMPPDVVTMHSRVVTEDADGTRRTLTLCYPDAADAAQGRVSVLSPLGCRLLGAAVPGTVQWQPPEGAARSLRLLELQYQPEASGDYAV